MTLKITSMIPKVAMSVTTNNSSSYQTRTINEPQNNNIIAGVSIYTKLQLLRAHPSGGGGGGGWGDSCPPEIRQSDIQALISVISVPPPPIRNKRNFISTAPLLKKSVTVVCIIVFLPSVEEVGERLVK